MAQQDPNDNSQVNDNTNVNQEDVSVNNNQDEGGSGNEPQSIDQIVDGIIAADDKRNKQQQGQRPNPQQQQSQPNRGSVATRAGNQSTQTQQQQPNARGIPVRNVPGAFIDQQGNIVDFLGRPLAGAGAEARVFQQAHGPMKNVLEKLQTAEQQIELFNKAHNISQQNGLTAADIMVGHQIAAAWKKDKAATINHLLTMAREAGINVEGVGSSQAVDVPAIVNAVEQKFAKMLERFEPVFKEWETHSQSQEFNNKVDREINQFFSDYPDARIQEEGIAEIMNASGSQLSMHQAYSLLMRYCHEKGLDWSKPLTQQVGVAERTGQQDGRAPTGNNRRAMPPIGGGNSAPSRVRQVTPRSNESFEAIFDEVLREQGLR